MKYPAFCKTSKAQKAFSLLMLSRILLWDVSVYGNEMDDDQGWTTVTRGHPKQTSSRNRTSGPISQKRCYQQESPKQLQEGVISIMNTMGFKNEDEFFSVREDGFQLLPQEHLFRLAELYRHQFANSESMEKARQLLEFIAQNLSCPATKRAAAYRNLGKLCERQQKVEQAISHLQKSLELNPSNNDVLLCLGDIYNFSLDHYEKAKEYYLKALKQSPSFYHKVRVFIARGDAGEGTEHFNKALEILGTENFEQRDYQEFSFRSYRGKGNAALAEGKGREEAIQCYTKALRHIQPTDPRYQTIQQHVAQLSLELRERNSTVSVTGNAYGNGGGRKAPRRALPQRAAGS